MTLVCKLCGAPVDMLTDHLFCRRCDRAIRLKIMEQFRLLGMGIRNCLMSKDVIVATNSFWAAWKSLATLQKFFDYGAIDDLQGLHKILKERFLDRMEHIDGDYLAENLKLIEREYKEKARVRRKQEDDEIKQKYGISACITIGRIVCPRCGAKIPEPD